MRAEGKDTAIDPTSELPHTIEVLPNVKAIQAHLSFLSKARYVEEHFTLYNRADLNEHKRVARPRGSAPRAGLLLRTFESTFGYSALEEEILRSIRASPR